MMVSIENEGPVTIILDTDEGAAAGGRERSREL
jgi:hypothetical protein